MKRLLISLVSLLACQFVWAQDVPHSITSFGKAKKLAVQVYKDQSTTFYCGCDYDRKKQVGAQACGYEPRKNPKRGARIEWEHVVPAHAFGHTRACWREALCSNSKGEAYKGRRCCGKIDPVFKAMAADLHNLVPAVGELNGDRSNFTFSMIGGEAREYGQCDFEVDFKLKRAEPRPAVRGDIARTYFYMNQTYGLKISRKQRKLFEIWSRQDPVDEWERTRNLRIENIQGNSNPFVN